MGVYGRAMAIAFGGLAGGGIGFYWRETYMLKVTQDKRTILEGQLNELVKSRKEKETELQSKRLMQNEQKGR